MWSEQVAEKSVYSHVIRISNLQLRLTSVWVKKSNQNNQIQSITLCNIYFSKKVYVVYNGSGAKPQKLGILENFCVKSNLTACKVILLTVSYGKK